MKSTKSNTILIFTDWYLPGYKAGGPIRSMANLVETMGDEISFKVVCSNRDYMDPHPYHQIEADVWKKVGKAQVTYLSEARQDYKHIKALIGEEKPHFVYINGLFSKVFSIYPLRAAARLGARTIVAPRGMLAPGALGIKSRKKSVFLKFSKAIGLYRNVIFHATHSHEVSHIRTIYGKKAKVIEVANLPSQPTIQAPKIKSKGYLNIVAIARIAPEKNIMFALECLSKLPSHLQVRVDFVGPIYDTAYFEACTKMAGKLPVNISISWEGAKEYGQMATYYDKAHLFFLPTLGENYGHAILEAMCAGLPALISDQTPWQDLKAAQLGSDIPLSNQQGFIDYICELSEMDSASYTSVFGQTASRARKLIDMSELISGYKKLFA